MNIQDLLNHGSEVTLAVSLNDLKQFFDCVLEEAKQELEQTVINGRAEAYLSPDKVCEMLDVDRSTLWRWNKRGYLSTIEVGGKRRYKLSDIKKILNGGL